jgi:hypothetical protein
MEKYIKRTKQDATSNDTGSTTHKISFSSENEKQESEKENISNEDILYHPFFRYLDNLIGWENDLRNENGELFHQNSNSKQLKIEYDVFNTVFNEKEPETGNWFHSIIT